MNKKAAMFGLDARVKRNCHPELVSGSQSCFRLDHLLKKQCGAMFGLDARIALAIFGALSVIVGATLYNTIQHTKVITLHQEFVEIEKAI